MKVSILTGGMDPHYAISLLSGLVINDIAVDFIGNDEMQKSEFVENKNVNYLNLRGGQKKEVQMKDKIIRVLKYYLKLIEYSIKTDSKLFHILWLNKFEHFDRTILNIFYKIMGKKIIFTAHNLNARERDGNDSLVNRLTLRFMYKTVDHIIVHTNKMKHKAVKDFNISENKVTVIPFGINIFTPKSSLLRNQAREKLKLQHDDKIALFFGNIAPYKGLELLILAIAHLKKKSQTIKLIIAGRIKNCEKYWSRIKLLIKEHNLNENIISKIEYIPEVDVEIYLKSADVLILPYKYIFQTGLLFLSYNFGLPVIATDVGSLREDIIEGKTGYICAPDNPEDLAEKITMYFQSDL